MGRESFNNIDSSERRTRRNLDGDAALAAGDLSKAYYYYVRGKNLEGLYKIAQTLSEQGREKEAADVLAKAHQLSLPDKPADKNKE